MESVEDIFHRPDGWISLTGIKNALSSIEGVEQADARTRLHNGFLEVIGILMVNEECPLSPMAVLDFVKQKFPKSCWPDQVLLAIQCTPKIASQRAA